MRKHMLYLGIFFLCLLIFSGCGKLERKGTRADNVPPKVYFANVPPESTYFSANPKFYWFGTDIDGFITAYQYAVMVTDSVISAGGIDTVKNFLYRIPSDSVSWVAQVRLHPKDIKGVHVVAEPAGHSRNVFTFADLDTGKYAPQYIFLRAVDNRDAVSEVINKMFYRNNHRPEARFDLDTAAFKAKNHYCLVETTATWKGISISWSGRDSLDYPEQRDEPPFQFKWELVGPFNSPSAVDTARVVVQSKDSIFVDGKWHYMRWVSERKRVFKGLKNFGEDQGNDAGYGWYQFRVRARDDAFVSTDTATTINFRVIKPRFLYAERDSFTILVVDGTGYGGRPGGPSETDTGLVRPFYREAFSQLPTDWCNRFTMWHDSTKPPNQTPKNAPGEDILSRHDLVVVLNLGSSPAIRDAHYAQYKEYMNVGGRLWLIGLNNFNVSAGREKPHDLATEIKGPSPNTYDVATAYLGIQEVFTPTWTILDTTTLEFIQAEPFGSWQNLLDTLQMDREKGMRLNGFNPNIPVRQFGIRGIPHVCYDALSNKADFEGRLPYQRRIYSFVSYYGSISPMQGKPCAVNYIGPTFRAAEFCFPLNLMKNEEPDKPASTVVTEMVKWFRQGWHIE